ncbi:cingulin-like protein 1 [Aplochiton taeniatus]
MESPRMTGSPDNRLQKQQHNPRGSPDSTAVFGVRVQVQGIKGHPYVILNNGGLESHRDVSAVGRQTDYSVGVVRGSPLGSPSIDQRSAHQQHASSPAEAGRTAAASVLNYQRHPELLRPYDPKNNNLDLLVPPEPSSVTRSRDLNSGPRIETSQVAKGSRLRIPLPAEGPEEAQDEAHVWVSASGRGGLARSPNSVNTNPLTSVGNLIDQFNSPLRRGRCGPRSRMDPEERKRSRSMDSKRASDPSSLVNAMTILRRETSGGFSAPGSPRVRLSNLEPTLASRRGESKSTTQLEERPTSPRPEKMLHRVEKMSLSASTSSTDESTERNAQVTPDILKGQQELPEEPKEDTTKQILFTYFKDGTTDDDSTTQGKVNLVIDRINELKWKTPDKMEEEGKDYAAEAKVLQERRAALEKEVSELKNQLQVETKNEKLLAKACEKARTDKKNLQEELSKCQLELSALTERLAATEAELQSTNQELVQVRAERDRSKAEMKDLQQQLSDMHDELDLAKRAEVESAEKEVILKDLAQLRGDFQEVMQVQEEQEEVLCWKERELTALKGALKEEVESHDKEMAALKELYEQELQQLKAAVKEARESNDVLGQMKAEVEEERGAVKTQVRELGQDREQLQGQIRQLESKVEHLNYMIQESEALEKILEEKTKKLERDKRQVEQTLAEVREREEEMCQSNQTLAIHLEDVQSKLTKLNQEHKELKERLKEEIKRTEELRKTQSALEEERTLQDRTVEQLQKKMSHVMEECEESTDRLQVQIDEAREKSLRELSELRRQLQEKGVELEKSRQTAQKLQEELPGLEEDLRLCWREREEAQQRGRQLEQRVEDLGSRNTATLEDRARQVKLMEGRITHLEEELNEERSSADLLMERVEKSKEQLEQMRSELQQERGVRQDLECDKMSLERQNKDLKSRVSYLEGSQRSNQEGLVSRLSGRIQELEERLHTEERDSNSLQQANRKLERKVKEMKIQVDEEHLSLQNQKDQLTQRLKTLKRQMDEAEAEIERQENGKKKLQRELDEQMDANEHLQSELSTLRSEMRRKRKSPPLMTSMDDGRDDLDDLGSD